MGSLLLTCSLESTLHNQLQHDQEKWTRGIPTTLRGLTEETWKHLRHRKQRLESGMRGSISNLKIKPSTQILAKFKMHQHQREYQKIRIVPIQQQQVRWIECPST